MDFDYDKQVTRLLESIELVKLINVFDFIRADSGIRLALYSTAEGKLVSVSVPLNSKLRQLCLFKGEDGQYYTITQPALRRLIDVLYSRDSQAGPWLDVKTPTDVRRVWLPVGNEGDPRITDLFSVQVLEWFQDVVGNVPSEDTRWTKFVKHCEKTEKGCQCSEEYGDSWICRCSREVGVAIEA